MQEPSSLPITWVIAFDESIEIIRATVSGGLTADRFKAVMVELIKESKRRDVYRLLFDCRGVSLAFNLSQVYALPEELRKLGMMSYHMVAIVYTNGPDSTPLFTFFDDRCHNVGLSQKAFTDYDVACLWLTGVDWSIVSSPTQVTA
jgi:hypothetical protein